MTKKKKLSIAPTHFERYPMGGGKHGYATGLRFNQPFSDKLSLTGSVGFGRGTDKYGNITKKFTPQIGLKYTFKKGGKVKKVMGENCFRNQKD